MPKPQPEQTGEIRIVDENLRYGFAQIPRPVLRAKGLSLKAKVVYTILLDYAWNNDFVFPGQPTMAAELDTSVDTVQRALQELKAYGLVDWKQQGLNKPNIYYILPLSRAKNVDLTDAGNRKLRFPETAKSTLQETADSGTKDTKSKDTKSKDIYPSKNRNSQKEEERYVNQGAVEQSEHLPASKGEDGRRRERVEQARFYEVDYGEVEDGEESTSKRRNKSTENRQTPPAARGGGFEAVGAILKDTRGRRGRKRAVDEDRQYFVDLWEEFGNELNDQAEMTASVSQLVNIFRVWHERTGGNRDGFLPLLYEARSRTKERSGSIKLKEQREGYAAKNRVPYFFATLRDLAGLRESPQEGLERAD